VPPPASMPIPQDELLGPAVRIAEPSRIPLTYNFVVVPLLVYAT
jgi:hypothetical protein